MDAEVGLRRGTSTLFLFLSFLTMGTGVGCRIPELSADEACKRIEPLRDAGWTPEDRDHCRADWTFLSREIRACATKCLEKEPQRYDDCSEDCGAKAAYPPVLCIRMAPDAGAPDDACIVRLSEVKAKRPRAYQCVAACVKHTIDPAVAAKCEAQCGL